MPPRPLDHLAVSLPVLFLKEKRSFVAYTPALDLSASGSTVESAKRNFKVTLRLFLVELREAGTFERVLRDMGWSKQERLWHPPVELQRVVQIPFRMPVAA
jgi:hypothetical protein